VAEVTENKPITDWTDEELRARLRTLAPKTQIGYSDVLNERRTRAEARHARATFWLSLAVGIATAVNALAAVAVVAR
jgi:hypothetical protein